MYEEAPDVAFLMPWLSEDAPGEDDEWRGHCPMEDHEDKNPSASFNFVKYEWFCLGCKAGGGIGQLISELKKNGHAGGNGSVSASGDNGGFEANVIDIRSGRRRRRRRQQLPGFGRVNGWNSSLLKDSERLAELLRERGITRETVENLLIGWDKDSGSYTLPFVVDGELVNVKHYRLHPDEEQRKMWSYTGHNLPRLYPVPPDEDDDHVLLCEGELDTLLAIQHGWTAVTGSHGAGVWESEWTKHFKDKRVTVIYDRDKAGEKGRRKVLNDLKAVAREIRFVDLPFTMKDENGEDLTDMWKANPETFAEDLKELVRIADRVHGKPEESESGRRIGILDSMNVELAGEKLVLRSQIVARTGATQSYPSKMEVTCSGDNKSKCPGCPMYAIGHQVGDTDSMTTDVEVEKSDPIIIDLIRKSSGERALKDAVKDHLGLHCSNKIYKVDELEHENVQVYGVRNAVDEEDSDSDDITSIRRVVAAGNFRALPNYVVNLSGTVVRDRKNNTNEFLSWAMEDTESDIDKFHMTPEMMERLKVFQPDNPRKPLEKLLDIAEDLAANVTHIYGRPRLHIAMDLVWHSVLSFRFMGKRLTKGWLEAMVAGDTRTGKSDVAKHLRNHYSAGRVVSGESATFAGLVGGSQKANEEWAVTWGALPMSDRRLVVIDEVSGLSHEKIGQMSSVRSSGVAQIHHITTDEVKARVRIVWMGNPRDNRPMKDHADGVQVVQELIGAPEDVARLDFAMSVTSDDVELSLINTPHHQNRKHLYTSDLCRDLVSWVWSRKPHHVKWEESAEREVISKTMDMAGKYVEDPPLIQGADVREKIARIAVAVAARTFSTEDGEHVVVTKYHVRAAVKFLDKIYSDEKFGYRERSSRVLARKRFALKNENAVINELLGDEETARFFHDTLTGEFSATHMQRVLNLDFASLNAKIGKYHGWGMIQQADRGGGDQYRLTAEFLDILRKLRKIKNRKGQR